ncbi:Oidioi.mRNA.OKI2018_I69.XSR.g15439.t1.cds [Oikopleura dioica]|uniref:Oidioi.mRNA.OKI2018_I69.XSR.g15439.t1.cds n=1 Tax=Oikopleura dioica TaxID=34765 RepID=A0ABN7SGY3_OIKDI|nr:Oidioi.mRNA.OKI2018_I69.XSR.g15439.t1.cds [Oikopleura dioica]
MMTIQTAFDPDLFEPTTNFVGSQKSDAAFSENSELVTLQQVNEITDMENSSTTCYSLYQDSMEEFCDYSVCGTYV